MHIRRRFSVQHIESELANATGRRRLSLTTIFSRSPSSFRAASFPETFSSQSVVSADIIPEIANFLSSADVLSLSLTASFMRNLLIPSLYECVLLKSSTQCRTTLSMLSSHPEICAHIRKLGVRPNYYLAWPKTDKVLDEDWVVLTIAKMAKHLLSLNAFEWSGNEIPRDLLWSSLREHCTALKNIWSTVGAQPVDPSSQLFHFSNLTSFSLTVRYGLTESGWINPSENLPQTFWDMLIKRSPDLEELVICSLSSSSRKFEFAPITEARWPKLHTLTLGSFGYTEDFSLGIAEDASFTRFLEGHPSLKFLSLQWNSRFFGSPYDLQMELAPAALPNIKSFSGIYQHLAKLPNIHDIHTLDLTCEPIPKHRLSTHICPLLASLTSLTTLDIWVHVSRDNTSMILSLFKSCRKLIDLHFMCTRPFPLKSLKQLLSCIDTLPQLKRFSLTKGHTYREERMLDSALLILRRVSSLERIHIRWAREKSPKHLKQEGIYEISSKDGLPCFIMVHELGIPLVGRPFERSYKHTLQPSSVVTELKQHHVVQMLRSQF